MPIYEYQCDSCQVELEKLQKISDEPLRICPECGEASLRKKVSAAGFRLKGGGWYETDFKAGNKKNLAGSGEDSNSGGAAAGGDAKADAKPAAKSESTTASKSETKSGGANSSAA